MHHDDPAPVTLYQRSIIGHLNTLSRGPVVGLNQCCSAKALRCLNAPEMSASESCVNDITVNPLKGLVQRNGHDRTLGVGEGRKRSVDHLGGNEGASRVVNDHVFRCDVLETVAHGLLSAVSAGHHHAALIERGTDPVDRLRRHYENYGNAPKVCKNIDRPFDQRPAAELLELFECGATRSFAASARRDDSRNRAGSQVGYPSTSSSIFSASSSLQFFEKVNSDTRIWRALVTMRFSPAERPFSWSRW